jgi:hypothetical protein
MSFTPFNAPIQQRPAAIKREHIDTGMDMKIVGEAFQGEEGLVKKLGELAERGMSCLVYCSPPNFLKLPVDTSRLYI